ncbi:hypothetical protein NE237_001323 [Protea cynaroides]|uniref:F-box domain-containing protein n=1 Tax=Protea cynaroides TaxID=273540 RepID=A0A9Q0KT44_9MAGN|nr:hypothetical protein NE237_001323 [Protea cynaroides]
MEKKAAACIPGGETEAITRRMNPFTGTSYFSSTVVVSDTETEKEKRAVYRRWSELPALTIDMILDRLDFVEKFRFASVCVTWRDAAPDFAKRRPQRIIPWLLFSQDTQTGALSFLNLPETMIHHVRIPQINMNLCYGSTQGWLFMFAGDACENNHCFLLNPISKAQIQLPPLSLESRQSFLKVLLSSSPAINEDWMVVAHTVSHGLLFCKPGDRSWSIGPPNSKYAFSFDYGDIIFSGGQVYVLSMLNTVWVFDIKTQNLVLMGGGASPAYDLHNDGIDHGDPYICYLVESNGELFLVARFLKNTAYHYTTIGFLLYKLHKNDNIELRVRGYVWVRQSSFGADRALFLSINGSKSVSTIENPGVQSNCIYFINDLHRQTGKPCDIGICHVEDGKIEPFNIPLDAYAFKFPSVWVTPSV